MNFDLFPCAKKANELQKSNIYSYLLIFCEVNNAICVIKITKKLWF